MDKKHLKWAIRRGMLELDLVLEGFVNKHYDNLSDTDKLSFEELLRCEDNDLHSWLIKQDYSNELYLKHKRIVDMIVQDALNIG